MGASLVHRRGDLATKRERRGKNDMDAAREREISPIRNLLGALMAAEFGENRDGASLLGAVALLADVPERGLVRGQVGVIVETLDDATVLVEFSDERGRAFEIAPVLRSALLVLRTVPRAA